MISIRDQHEIINNRANARLEQHTTMAQLELMPKVYIYIILKPAPFDHNEYVTAFSTEALAIEFIKVNKYKQMWIEKQELK